MTTPYEIRSYGNACLDLLVVNEV